MDDDARRQRDLEAFLSKALEVEMEDPTRQLTGEDLKSIALKSGLTENDWTRLMNRVDEHFEKGRNFLEFGNHEDAVAELDQAVVLAPYRVDILYQCGKAHQLRSEKEGHKASGTRAEELFEQCLRLEPHHDGAAKGLSQLRLRGAAKKKMRHRVLVLLAALVIAGGGFVAIKPAPGTPDVPAGTTIEQRENLPDAPTLRQVQRSGNLIAIPRFSSVKAAFPANLPTDIVQIEVGFTDDGHVLALRENGTVLAWGANTYRQADLPPLGKVTQVAAGWRHSLALQEDGTVVAWGDNAEGQCDVPEGLSDVVQISAGVKHSVALTRDGKVVAWGSNAKGQCEVPDDLQPVIRLAEICADHTVVVTREGKLAVWGNNENEEWVVPNDEIKDARVVKVWAGGENYALLDDDRLLHWGRALRSHQLPPVMTGVADVFSGYPATVMIRKENHVVTLHGAYKNNPGQLEELRDWKDVIVGPSFFYGISDEPVE